MNETGKQGYIRTETVPTQTQIEAVLEDLRHLKTDCPMLSTPSVIERVGRIIAALTAAAEVQKNKANWKVCKTCNCWVKRPLEWEPECSEVPDASSKGFFTAAAEVDMKCGGNHRIEAIKTLTAAADVPDQEHILQKPGQKSGLLPSGNTAAAVGELSPVTNSPERLAGYLAEHKELTRLATIERCAQVVENFDLSLEYRVRDTIKAIAAEIRALKDKT